MQWFEGGIADAVAAAKQRNAVFVVFVEGKDEASKKTADAINSPEVSTKLQSGDYVAIRIESDTTAHRQFAQIYQMVPVPSLFFIGNAGLPIEILAGATDSQTLLGCLQFVEAVLAQRQAPAAAAAASSSGNTSTSAASIASEVASSAPSETLVTKPPSNAGSSALSGPASENIESKVSATSSGSNSGSTDASSLEERIERAKELVEKKRLEKMREEQEEERRKEIERRKVGRDVQEMKKWQQGQELKELKEQRRKEKEARQRVLDQIAQDRANRSAQAAVVQRPQSSAPELTQRSPPVSDGRTRLQFRLPDGSTHTSSFESTSSLGHIRSYVMANVEIPFKSFMLATTFPRREFREEDNALTLQELGLVPSAVMLVIPSGGAGSVQRAGGGFGGVYGAIYDGLSGAIWMLLSPVITVFTALRNRLFGERQIGRGTSTSGTGEGSTGSSEARREKRSKRASTGGTIRRTGSSNIHRLHQNNSSSDDDNNTWNGNSTQQM